MDYAVSAHAGSFLWAILRLSEGRVLRRESWPVGRVVRTQDEIDTADRTANDWTIAPALEADQCN